MSRCGDEIHMDRIQNEVLICSGSLFESSQNVHVYYFLLACLTD